MVYGVVLLVTASVSINRKEAQALREVASALKITKHALIKGLIRKAIKLYTRGQIDELRRMIEVD